LSRKEKRRIEKLGIMRKRIKQRCINRKKFIKREGKLVKGFGGDISLIMEN
jgi:hypothetical protein